ncbi:MAG: 2-phosphosulfolactate phosphatase [Chloroflexota bacterium]
MQFHYANLDTCARARGAVVVIDVLRAFTTAAYAFARGAVEILLTAEVEDAFALRRRFPGALLMGEIDGLPIPGFDFGNSPVQVGQADLRGRRLVQRTTHGTQGVVRCRQADLLLASSFVCAAATAACVRRSGLAQFTFVSTGAPLAHIAGPLPGQGDEDLALADYLQALLSGPTPDPAPYLARVAAALAGNKFLDPEHALFNPGDLHACQALDRFAFALSVERREDLLVMQPLPPLFNLP